MVFLLEASLADIIFFCGSGSSGGGDGGRGVEVSGVCCVFWVVRGKHPRGRADYFLLAHQLKFI